MLSVSVGIPALVMIAGALAYLFASGSSKQIGLIAFAVGLFFVVQALSHATMKL